MTFFGTGLPPSSKRKPVSMGCWIVSRTSITSPAFAVSGSWTRATMSAGVQAGGLGDFHLGIPRPPRAVGELRQRQHALRPVQAHARCNVGAAGRRVEVEGRHERPGIALGNER